MQEKNWHKVSKRIYYSDTDCGKVVYYANYLKYFEIGRTELLRDAGIELDEYHQLGIIFVVTRVEIDYRASAKYNDNIVIASSLHEYNRKIFTIKNKIFNQKDVMLVSGLTKCACVNESGKLASIPEKILSVFSNIIMKTE